MEVEREIGSEWGERKLYKKVINDLKLNKK